jgi:hypothetical protein
VGNEEEEGRWARISQSPARPPPQRLEARKVISSPYNLSTLADA